MLRTRAVPSLDSGLKVLCVKVQAPCYTIVCDQAEAPVSWHDKVPRSDVTSRLVARGIPHASRISARVTEVGLRLRNYSR